MTTRPAVWILLLCSLLPRHSAAQTILLPAADSLHALLVISTSPESAWVMLDSSVAGRTPCSLAVRAPARYHVRILSPDVSSWLSTSIDDTLEAMPGETVTRFFVLETWTLVTSSPMGAEIAVGDSILGTTPLIMRPGRLSSTTPLTFRLHGYEPATANLGMAAEGILRVPLRATSDMNIPVVPSGVTEARPSHLRLYLTGGGAIVAGAAAAYFKMKADNANNDYLATKDPAFSSDRDRFDTTSGVFLIVAQASLGLFVAFLMSE